MESFILPQSKPLLLIPFHSDWNGRKISYRHINRNNSPPCSTSGQISACSGLFRSISAEIQDSAGMSWSYGSKYRERKREVLRYRCDVRECFVWDREQTKGENKFNTCLFAFSIKIEATSKRSAISVSSPLFFKVLRETRFWTRNMQNGLWGR